MLNWKREYIALLSRYYRENVLKEASEEAFLEANAVVGRAAHVRGSTVGRWITGESAPSPIQGERLLRWSAMVGWWDWDERRNDWKRVTIAEKLSELISAARKGGSASGGRESKKGG